MVLGWGEAEVHDALERLRTRGVAAELLEGGTMAPHLLPYLERHERVLLLGVASLGGPAGSVYRFRGSDLEKMRPIADLHEAALELDLHEKQPHAFMVILSEPGPAAAGALASAAERQLLLWAEPAMNAAAGH